MGIILVPWPGTLCHAGLPRPSGAALIEDSGIRKPGEERSAGREQPYLLLGGRIACGIGVLLGAVSILAALVGGNPNISGGALGAALGILGFFLGARRLATATVVFCVAAIFFALAASQGLIPWIEPYDRELAGQDPASKIRETN